MRSLAEVPNPEIVREIYRAFVLLGADHELLSSVGSWGDSLPDRDVLANLKGWNEAFLAEIRARTQHYEMTSRPQACNQDEVRKTA
jgi:hypothetical protein